MTVLSITEALAKAHVKGYTKAGGTVLARGKAQRARAHLG